MSTRTPLFALVAAFAALSLSSVAEAASTVRVTASTEARAYTPNGSYALIVRARNTSGAALGADARVCIAKPVAATGARMWTVARASEDRGDRLCLPLGDLAPGAEQMWGLTLRTSATMRGALLLALTTPGATRTGASVFVLDRGTRALELSTTTLRPGRELRLTVWNNNYTDDPRHVGKVCVRVRGASLIKPAAAWREAGGACWFGAELSPSMSVAKTVRVRTTKRTHSVKLVVTADGKTVTRTLRKGR